MLAVLGLAGLTYGLTELGNRGASPDALVAVGGRAYRAWSAFVIAERRSTHPLVPPALFTDRTFRVANAITLLIYGALGTVFLLLVLQLQTVAGFSPVAAGTALLPVTAVLLVFSARAGVLAGRIGPRLPMTIGPLLAAAGLLLMLRIGPATSWLVGRAACGVGLRSRHGSRRRSAHHRCVWIPRLTIWSARRPG